MEPHSSKHPCAMPPLVLAYVFWKKWKIEAPANIVD
jgi:hypothetical protein